MAPSSGTIPHTNTIHSGPVDFSLPLPHEDLQGKVVLITGGASGIGAALARALVQHGAQVLVGDIDAALGTQVVAELRRVSASSSSPSSSSSEDATHHFIPVDVTQWDSQLNLFREAVRLSATGGLDAVVAGAGINDASESEALEFNVPRVADLSFTTPPAAPRLRTLAVNLIGTMYTSTLALSYLSENPGSVKCAVARDTERNKDTGNKPASARDRHLLLIGSIAGVLALPGSVVYVAAKHGVTGLWRGLRLSAPVLHGVRVNLLAPQYVPTPMHGVRGNAVLAGVPKTEMADVLRAALRMLADRSIIGRGIVAGARAAAPDRGFPSIGESDMSELSEEKVSVDKDRPSTNDLSAALWDIYAHDFEQTDLLMRRTMALLNLAAAARDTTSFLRDLYLVLCSVVWALWRSVLRGLRIRA